MSIGSIISSFLPASSAPGLGTQAVQRQQIVQNLAIKQQAQADQAIAQVLAQAAQQIAAQQASHSQAGFGGPPPRGTTLNILV